MRSIGVRRISFTIGLTGLLAAALFVFAPRPALASPAAQQEAVYMNDEVNSFDPFEIEVPVGTTVTWVSNPGPFIHTVTSDVGLFDSGFLYNGQTFSITFDTPGDYGYVCVPHLTLGMAGVVRVR